MFDNSYIISGSGATKFNTKTVITFCASTDSHRMRDVTCDLSGKGAFGGCTHGPVLASARHSFHSPGIV